MQLLKDDTILNHLKFEKCNITAVSSLLLYAVYINVATDAIVLQVFHLLDCEGLEVFSLFSSASLSTIMVYR